MERETPGIKKALRRLAGGASCYQDGNRLRRKCRKSLQQAATPDLLPFVANGFPHCWGKPSSVRNLSFRKARAHEWAWFFSTAKRSYLKGITFYKPSYFQTRRAEIPSLKGFPFYLMRHFPPPEAAFLLIDCHRPQESSRFPCFSERNTLVQAGFFYGWMQCCAIAWCFSCKAAEGQPAPFLLCVNRFIELLNFDKK